MSCKCNNKENFYELISPTKSRCFPASLENQLLQDKAMVPECAGSVVTLDVCVHCSPALNTFPDSEPQWRSSAPRFPLISQSPRVCVVASFPPHPHQLARIKLKHLLG